MCGISGCVSTSNVVPIILEGLSKLEYRGYDSAGIAIIKDGSLEVRRTEGRLRNLEILLEREREKEKKDKTKMENGLFSNIGIGHTRWATHGKPCEKNAHPQRSEKFAIVHNGIIENYLQLSEFLRKRGFTFTSDTDTEIIAKLLEYHYKSCECVLDAIIKTMAELHGSYAMAIICSDTPDQIYAVRKYSPLIVGLCENCNLVASDIPAVLSYTRKIYVLNDGEIAQLNKNNVNVYDSYGNMIDKEIFTVDWDEKSVEKGDFEHFMIKEIYEQPLAIRNTVNSRIKDGKICNLLCDKEFENVRQIYVVACGSSYNVGMIAKYFLEKVTHIRTEALLASEFRYFQPIIDEYTMVIMISQSGETADTLAAMREARKLPCKLISIVNVMGSSMDRESDCVLYTNAGPEIAVATTKAYSAQISLIYLIGLKLAEVNNRNIELCTEILKDIIEIPNSIDTILSQSSNIHELAKKYNGAVGIFFIGRGIDYSVSLEGALKLKELSYLNAQAYAAGELKHGPLSLIENGSLVIVLATQSELNEKIVSNIKEVKARGADVISITYQDNNLIQQVSDHVIIIPKIHQLLMAQLSVVPMQLLSYYVSKIRGCNVDKPRNLAKSVTVE